MDINNITLTGRLVTDAELTEVGEDRQVCKMRIAFDQRSTKDPAGFIDVEVWGQYATTCETLTKGQRVGVVGAVHYHAWQTADGAKRSAISVTANQVKFLSPRAEADEAELATVASA